jgi:hypothetical protein
MHQLYKTLNWLNYIGSFGRGLGYLAMLGGIGWLICGKDGLDWIVRHWWLVFLAPLPLIILEISGHDCPN